MAYRYSDTMKWQDEWFVDLPTIEKLLFIYLCDNCDIAGFCELSYRKIAFDLGLKESEIKGAVKGLNKAVFLSDDEKCLLVKNFIKHQKNLPINPENKSHQGILKRAKLYMPKFPKVELNYQEGYLGIGALLPLQRGTGNNIGNGNTNGINIKLSIEEKQKIFKESLYPFTKYAKNPNGIYEKELIKEFFDYWSEPNRSKSKLRYEMEKTWDLKLRLVRWSSNNKDFGKKSDQQQLTSYQEKNNTIDHSLRD